MTVHDEAVEQRRAKWMVWVILHLNPYLPRLGTQPPPDYCLDLCKHPLSTWEEALPRRRQLPNVPLRANQDRCLPTEPRAGERSTRA